MKEKITILTSYEVDGATQKRLEAIYPDLNIHHTPELRDMDPWIEEADIIMARDFSDDLLKRARRLRWLQAVGAGIEHLLTQGFIESHVVLTNASGIHAIPVSEHVFALLLALTRRICRCYGDEGILAKWQRIPGEELYAKTMGVLGVGQIGREIARKAKAFGMRTRGFDSVPIFVPYLDEFYLPGEIDQFFTKLDVLVISVSMTGSAKGMVNHRLISMMNKGSYLINVARGGAVVEDDLIEVLEHGPLAGAGLDVFIKEPLPMDSKLRWLPNVVLTPHIAGWSSRYEERIFQLFVENFRRWIQNRNLINIVDKKKKS